MNITVSHARPEYVKHPVECHDGFWVLGLVVPDQKGYTPNGGIARVQSFHDAVIYCEDEAAMRGISNEACQAAIASSMRPVSFDQALAAIFRHQRRQQAGMLAALKLAGEA